ncbi:MAG: hypothetical protein Q9198_011180 [Flavoplaca austrocitrina]
MTRKEMLIVTARIARYAAAYTASKGSSASLYRDSQATGSSKGSKNSSRTSPILPAQTARRKYHRSNVELKSLDNPSDAIIMGKPDRSRSTNGMLESPTTIGHRQPSIFPGIVRQRTRRKSLRQSSGSENDYDGSGLAFSRSGTLSPDGQGPSSVPEESD